MIPIPFYLLSSLRTAHILPLTNYLYKKYWLAKQEFKIIYNNGDLQTWSYQIFSAIIENEHNPYFILALDDFWPYSKLNEELFEKLLAYAYRTKKVGKIELGNWQKNFKNFTEMEPEIVWIDEKENYKLNLQISIWNRDYILKYFWHNWSPWDVEIIGSEMAKYDGWKRVATTAGLVLGWNDRSAYSGHWPGKVNVTGMPAEDIKYFVDNNLLKYEDLVWNV